MCGYAVSFGRFSNHGKLRLRAPLSTCSGTTSSNIGSNETSLLLRPSTLQRETGDLRRDCIILRDPSFSRRWRLTRFSRADSKSWHISLVERVALPSSRGVLSQIWMVGIVMQVSSSNISARLNANVSRSIPRTFRSHQQTPNWLDSGLAGNLGICNQGKGEACWNGLCRLRAL